MLFGSQWLSTYLFTEERLNIFKKKKMLFVYLFLLYFYNIYMALKKQWPNFNNNAKRNGGCYRIVPILVSHWSILSSHNIFHNKVTAMTSLWIIIFIP